MNTTETFEPSEHSPVLNIQTEQEIAANNWHKITVIFARKRGAKGMNSTSMAARPRDSPAAYPEMLAASKLSSVSLVSP